MPLFIIPFIDLAEIARAQGLPQIVDIVFYFLEGIKGGHWIYPGLHSLG